MIKYILSTILFGITSANIKTIGREGSGADYICDGVDDHIQFQKAICEAKGQTFDETLTYREGYNTCGYKHPGSEHDPYPDGNLTLKILPGTYNLNRQLYIYSNFEMIGEGMSISIIRLQDEAISFYQKFSESGNWELTGGQAGFMRAFFSNNLKFVNLTFDGNKDNQISDTDGLAIATETYGRDNPYSYGRFAVYTEASDNVVIDNCEIKNWQGYGLDPHGVGGKPIYGTNLIVSNNIVHNNNWDGITIDKTRFFECYNNYAYDNGRHGINLVTGTEQGDVYNNTLVNNGWFYDKERDGIPEGKGCGIMAQNNQLYDTKLLNIYNNTVKTSNYAGICLHSVWDMVVYDNIIEDGQQWCIRLALQSDNTDGSYDNTIENNTCNHPRGIYLTKDSYHNKVRYNTISTDSDKYGVRNTDENKNEATNVICENVYMENTKAGEEVFYKDGSFPKENCDGSVVITTQAPTTSTTPAPTLASIPDPFCDYGIKDGNVCCASTCIDSNGLPQCGGSGCGSLSGGSNSCCKTPIRSSGISCEDSPAPCNIGQIITTAAPTIYTTPAPTLPSIPDPTCESGIKQGNVCCASTCLNSDGLPQCGGSGCGSREGGNEGCCTSTIKIINNSCNDQSAPCVIGETITPSPTIPGPTTPDPTCENGIIKNGVCCSAECGTCGGSECSLRYLGSSHCCTSTIKNNGNSCSEQSAPCVL